MSKMGEEIHTYKNRKEGVAASAVTPGVTWESRTEAAFISLFDTGIRSCARNHRNSLSRVIRNVAESDQALMARHRTSASGESARNCIRISYSLYLRCRTGPS